MPRLGLTLAPAGEVAGSGSEGVVVTDVEPDGIAAEHGFKTGDVILEVAGKTVASPADVRDALGDAQKDGKRTVLMRVKSGDSNEVRRRAARPRLNRMGRTAGIRRPRRWCEPGGRARQLPVPSSSQFRSGFRRPRRAGVGRGAAG